MKINITNLELEKALNILNAENSFRNNPAIKLPSALRWAVRVNVKTMMDRYKVYEEARAELGQEFIDAGKVDNDQVKEEYLNEYQIRMAELLFQSNELDITPVKETDYKDRDDLSSPEEDILIIMTEQEKDDKETEE